MLLRRVARPLLAATFVADGIDTLRNPTPKVEVVEPLLAKGRAALPTERSVDPALVVQAGAAVKIGAGLMFAFGQAPRIAAVVLAAELIPTTAAEYPFSSEGPPRDRKAQQTRFLHHLSLLGALLLAMTDTGGRPSVSWRAKKGAKRLTRRARKGAQALID